MKYIIIFFPECGSDTPLVDIERNGKKPMKELCKQCIDTSYSYFRMLSSTHDGIDNRYQIILTHCLLMTIGLSPYTGASV